MSNYESVLIARQDLGTSQVDDLVANLSDVIKTQGGEVVKVDNWGLKNLAYRIKKNRKGHYVVLDIVAPASAIFEYERLVRLNEDIIRYMTVKVDEFNSEMSTDEELQAADESIVMGE
ncbi:MAG: 30S ribosomal protein S6 [Alphaproteobacteria bacterium]|nr:30S ribosomal protein S6 [Alphaproteobacteria bacterium]